jgi:hypothetical protein
MNLRDVGSETSVNDTVQTNKNDKYIYTCLMSISRFALRDKVTLRLLKLLF